MSNILSIGRKDKLVQVNNKGEEAINVIVEINGRVKLLTSTAQELKIMNDLSVIYGEDFKLRVWLNTLNQDDLYMYRDNYNDFIHSRLKTYKESNVPELLKQFPIRRDYILVSEWQKGCATFEFKSMSKSELELFIKNDKSDRYIFDIEHMGKELNSFKETAQMEWHIHRVGLAMFDPFAMSLSPEELLLKFN